MKTRLHRFLTALTSMTTLVLLAAGCNEPRNVPKLVNDPQIMNKSGSRVAAFQDDEWFAPPGAPHLRGSAWATIDPNNAFITRVEVDFMDDPTGSGASVSSSDVVGEDARPFSQAGDGSWHPNEWCRTDGDKDHYHTLPCRWVARLPRREGMGAGSTVQYQFQVFYIESPGGAEKSVVMGYRTVTLGAGSTVTTSAGSSLTVGGAAASVTINFTPPPATRRMVRFYSEPDSVLQVFNGQGEPITSLWFEPNQQTQNVSVKATRPSGGSPNALEGMQSIQAGSAVLWTKASGWSHGKVTFNISPEDP